MKTNINQFLLLVDTLPWFLQSATNLCSWMLRLFDYFLRRFDFALAMSFLMPSSAVALRILLFTDTSARDFFMWDLSLLSLFSFKRISYGIVSLSEFLSFFFINILFQLKRLTGDSWCLRDRKEILKPISRCSLSICSFSCFEYCFRLLYRFTMFSCCVRMTQLEKGVSSISNTLNS